MTDDVPLWAERESDRRRRRTRVLWALSFTAAFLGFEASGHYGWPTYVFLFVLLGLAQTWPRVAPRRPPPPEHEGLEGRGGRT